MLTLDEIYYIKQHWRGEIDFGFPLSSIYKGRLSPERLLLMFHGYEEWQNYPIINQVADLCDNLAYFLNYTCFLAYQNACFNNYIQVRKEIYNILNQYQQMQERGYDLD